MGRTEKSQGLAPPAIRKDARAKQARHVINKVIPALLASNARARKATENSELIVDPGRVSQGQVKNGGKSQESQDASNDAAYVKRKGQGKRKLKAKNEDFDELEKNDLPKIKPKGKRRNDSLEESLTTLTLNPSPPPTPPLNRSIRIITTDTLTAAHLLTTSPKSKPSKHRPNTAILNMASPLRPGGGVLSGATSQEEFLCARTTLLPSLHESFYRLPEFGGIWSSDILVFRSSLPLSDSKGELDAKERFWVDVVSAGMLRFPELEGEEDEVKWLGKKDREIVERKMRAVLRILEGKGVERVVLGAWGCGAYGNPVRDVAGAWRAVLQGGLDPDHSKGRGKSGKSAKEEVETWPQLKEVVFAISSRRMAEDFARAFGAGVEVERGPSDAGHENEGDEEGEDPVAEELRTKIAEMDGQVSKVWNPDLKARMTVILDGLRTQLRDREAVMGVGQDSVSGLDSEQDGMDSDVDSDENAGILLEDGEDDEDTQDEQDEDEDINSNVEKIDRSKAEK